MSAGCNPPRLIPFSEGQFPQIRFAWRGSIRATSTGVSVRRGDGDDGFQAESMCAVLATLTAPTSRLFRSSPNLRVPGEPPERPPQRGTPATIGCPLTGQSFLIFP